MADALREIYWAGFNNDGEAATDSVSALRDLFDLLKDLCRHGTLSPQQILLLAGGK